MRRAGSEPLRGPGMLLRIVLSGSLSFVLAACGGHPVNPSPRAGGVRSDSPSPLERIPVTKVTDGDTFHVDYHGKDERVRLIGVDTPEVSWYGGQAECFGEEAGLYARERLSSRTVGLGFDADLRDPFDRLLAYVYVGDELFNLTLVRLGYATADPVAPNTAKAPEFAAAEAEARAAGKGLWSACPTPGE